MNNRVFFVSRDQSPAPNSDNDTSVSPPRLLPPTSEITISSNTPEINTISFAADKPTPTKPVLPKDDYDIPAKDPEGTIYYFAISTPHADTFSIRGPYKSIPLLLNTLNPLCNNSPRALRKLEILRDTPALCFDELGFTQFIVPLDRGSYIQINTIRETNPDVHAILPCPVYIVTSHGPLDQDMRSSLRPAAQPGRLRGNAANSAIVGSFVEVDDAIEAAREALKDLVGEEENVMFNEAKEAQGKSRWIFWGMKGRRLWEVRVRYEGEDMYGSLAGVKGKWRIQGLH